MANDWNLNEADETQNNFVVVVAVAAVVVVFVVRMTADLFCLRWCLVVLVIAVVVGVFVGVPVVFAYCDIAFVAVAVVVVVAELTADFVLSMIMLRYSSTY